MVARILILLLIALPASSAIIPASRLITWQDKVGVDGGIPTRSTICATLTSSATAAQINTAISACPAGQVVYLGAGTYTLTSGITINKGITLRGAGASSTILKYTGSGGYIITISNGGGIGSGVNITSGYTKDSASIVVSSASGLAEGGLIWIDQLNDGDLVTNVGAGGTCTWCGRSSGTRSMAQISEVTSVAGTTIGIDPVMHYTYTASLDPEIAIVTSVVSSAGIEDLKI